MPQAPSMFGIDMLLLVGLAMLMSLTACVICAGVDFGGGLWDLLASGPRRESQREVISQTIGPMWKTHYVSMIFPMVILFTGFPRAFIALALALFLPFCLVLVGLVLRSAAFVSRSHADVAAPDWRIWSWIFGAASAIAPFILGASLAVVSSGGIRVENGAVVVDPLHGWWSPVSLLTGALTLAICAYLAAVFLTVATDGEVREDFRQRALAAWAVVAILPVVLLFARPASLAPTALGIVLAALAGWAVYSRKYRLGRAAAVLEVVVMLWGWALAQWPYIIYPDYTVYNSAGSPSATRLLLQMLPFSFALLIAFWRRRTALFKGRAVGKHAP